jgi:flagellar L-ring protein precursor FlgH
MTSSAPLPLGIPAWSRRKRRPGEGRRGWNYRCEVKPEGGRSRARGTTLLAATVVAAAALAASPAMAKKHRETGFEAVLPVAAPQRPADGSIFSAAAYAPLYGGTRAHAVGDALTILLVESTTATKAVNSKSSKDGGIALVPPKAGPLSVNPDKLSASNNSNFDGKGSASQTSSLAGALSVTIAEVRPNGTALVRGEKQMLLSQGREWIQLSGIVRLSDIDQDNTIASTRVADARIEYSGKGALQNASKQGWLGQFFNMISPF